MQDDLLSQAPVAMASPSDGLDLGTVNGNNPFSLNLPLTDYFTIATGKKNNPDAILWIFYSPVEFRFRNCERRVTGSFDSG